MLWEDLFHYHDERKKQKNPKSRIIKQIIWIRILKADFKMILK